VTWKDKLEIGLKEDAPYPKDNLPAGEVRGPEKPAGPGRSPEIPMARGDKNQSPASLAFARQCARLAHHPRAERSSETQAQGCLTVRLEQARRDRPYRSRLDVRADLSRQKPARVDVVP
jgi:hypothetical protein